MNNPGESSIHKQMTRDAEGINVLSYVWLKLLFIKTMRQLSVASK